MKKVSKAQSPEEDQVLKKWNFAAFLAAEAKNEVITSQTLALQMQLN